MSGSYASNVPRRASSRAGQDIQTAAATVAHIAVAHQPMELEHRYEDDRVRITRANKGEAERFAPDPTVLNLDAATEEPFESRVYPLSELSLMGLVAHTVAEDPTLDPSDVMEDLVASDPTMRFVAKR